MRRTQMLIGGNWIESEQHFESFDPATGQTFGLVDRAIEAHVNSAVLAAKNALPGWRALGAERRAEVLGRVVERLRSEYGDEGQVTPLKELITSEMGKRHPEADIEVVETSDMLSFFVQEGPSLLSPKELKLDAALWPTKKSQVVFESVGVVGVIKPWNYPLELPIWSIGPALIAGNTIVFKPSEHSSFVGVAIGKILHESGVPSGVVNVITGDESTGRLLVRHDDVDMITFTGSALVGREIAMECASRLRRSSLELGGNDAAVVAADADTELVANGLVWGSFANAGQVCVRPKRVFVHREVADQLISLIVDKTRKLRADIDYGPLVSKDQLERVERQVTSTIEQGAKVLTGGHRPKDKRGYYFEPTVLADLKPDMTVMAEECFGPVMPIMVVGSIDEGIRLANATDYGLGASVWTRDREAGTRAASQMEAGMVWVNDVNVAFPQAPWGGVKQSGPGVELGEWGLYEYVIKKHINVETSDSQHRAWWFPYQAS